MNFDSDPIRILQRGDVTLPKRDKTVNKYDCGRVLVIGGCVGYTGAPVMCARAALRAGAGLVYAAVPSAVYSIAAGKLLEAMPFPLPCDGAGRFSVDAVPELLLRLQKCEACVLGPGLGRSEALTYLVRALIQNSAVPLILDADGLYALSLDMSVLKKVSCPVIVTPHRGEFARMGGTLTESPVNDAAAFTKKYGCVTVLKGPETAIAFPDRDVTISRFGNPGMASGGSGDVLSGLIGGLAAQLPVKDAVSAGVYIHGRSGDLCAERFGEYSMLPGDMIESIPEVMKNMIQ